MKFGSITLGAVLVVIVAIIIVGFFWSERQEARRQASIAERNAAAAQDTIRRYQADSTNAVNLMAFQDSINTDSIVKLNTALGLALTDRNQTAHILTEIRFEFSELQRQITAEQTITRGGDRQATFEIEGPPVEGIVNVVAPSDRDKPMVMQPSLRVTPFTATYLIGCDEQHSAIVNVETPDWVTLQMTQGIIDPNVCHPYRPVKFGSFKLTTGGLAVGGTLGILLGWAIASLTGG